MPLTNLNIGAAPNDGTGDTLRSGGQKINTNYTFTVTTDTTQTITGTKTFTQTVTGGKFSPTANTVTGNGMYLPAANTLAFSTNGVHRMRITSAGNVGIGTTSPEASLEVNGGVITNTIGSFEKVRHGFELSQGSNRYLLLVKNVVDGGSVSGRIIGKRNDESSAGRNGGYIDFAITGRNNGAPAVAWVSNNFVENVGLVTLDYDDGTGVANWVAIDAVSTGTSGPFNNAYFDGGAGQGVFTWVEAASVSNVVSRPSDMTLNFGERMRITSAGVVQLPSGSPGIKFGTRNANLADYEEGTWTPNSSLPGFTANTGHYIKIGKKVTAWYAFTVNSTSTSIIRLAGLPFTPTKNVSGVITFTDSANLADAPYQWLPSISTIDLYKSDGVNRPNHNELNGRFFNGFFTYEA